MKKTRKVAYLTPLYFDEKSCLGGGERYPLNLARGVVQASAGRCQVELISFGDAAVRGGSTWPGVTLRVLPPPAGRPARSTWSRGSCPRRSPTPTSSTSTRPTPAAREMGLLVAKQQRQADLRDRPRRRRPARSGPGVGILELADRIVAYSDFGASLYRTQHADRRSSRGASTRPASPRPAATGRATASSTSAGSCPTRGSTA